jgi:hypothetical protein
MKMKKFLLGVIFTNLSVFCFGQQNIGDSINSYGMIYHPSVSLIGSYEIAENLKLFNLEPDNLVNKGVIISSSSLPRLSWEKSRTDLGIHTGKIGSEFSLMINKNKFMKQQVNFDFTSQSNSNKKLSQLNDDFFEKNRRNIYSSMWAFASLNYLYCDLVAFMDKDLHTQYHTGVVDGTNLTPQFLTGAAVMMQIAIANVFLPQVIKNDRTLKWVQVASGITMTLIQSATLFVGKPTPYYATFSALEIGATTFITINALKWKTNSKKQLPIENY